MTWGLVAVAGATVVGGAMSSRAAGKAAGAQADAAAASNELQWEQYQQTREDNAPALEARNKSLAALRSMLGIDGGAARGAPTAGEVMSEPGYAFGLQQGQQALDRQAAARGMRNSGAALMAAQRYGNDYATTKYNEAFNRSQTGEMNRYNQLAGVAGLGQAGASQVASSGSQYATSAGNALMGAANAQGAAGIAQADTWGNVGNQLAGWWSNQGGMSGGSSGPSNASIWTQINGG